MRLYAQPPQRFDIIITELLPDPAPPIGLPNNEFIELKNVTTHAINLRGWKLSDGTATATINTNITLQPDSFVIICANTTVPLYTTWGTTIGVTNFPALNNDADIITLYAPEGNAIHTVAYTDQWYENAVKAGGGWTLEMIDTRNPCTGAGNWKAATHNSGGTPGRENSIKADNRDETPPALVGTFTTDSLTIIAVFDESLDSVSGAVASRYSFSHAVGNPVSATPQAPMFKEVVLKLSAAINKNQVYHLTVKGVTDCSGNTIGMMNSTKVGLPVPADTHDVIINELLFNPPSGGTDYAELYNRSNKTIDLKQLYIANRSAAGALAGIQQVTATSRLLFPGEYMALTEDARWLQQQYLIKEPAVVTQLPSLPSMPDDKGTVVIINAQGTVVDEVQYDHKWHFALISNEDGVALERIDYSKPTQDSHNWMSAAATVSYGTPGYRNSQFRADLQPKGTVTVTPSLFSPDNDAVDDFVNIQYQMTEPGYVANITIFDANGIPVRHLIRSATIGQQSTFRWDGLDNNRRKLPIGIYVIFTELFNLQGKTKKFRNSVTLARKF
jgi:hypothetical protein